MTGRAGGEAAGHAVPLRLGPEQTAPVGSRGGLWDVTLRHPAVQINLCTTGAEQPRSCCSEGFPSPCKAAPVTRPRLTALLGNAGAASTINRFCRSRGGEPGEPRGLEAAELGPHEDLGAEVKPSPGPAGQRPPDTAGAGALGSCSQPAAGLGKAGNFQM